MPATILAVAEVADGALTRLSTEVATLARGLADAAGGTAVGLVVDPAPDAAAGRLAGLRVPRGLDHQPRRSPARSRRRTSRARSSGSSRRA